MAQQAPLQSGWRISPEGKGWLIVTCALILVGVLRNVNLLTLLGFVMLALFVLQGVAVGRGLRSLSVRRWSDSVLHAGAGCRVELRVHNEGGWSVKGLWVEQAGPGHHAGWLLDALEPDGRRAVRCEVVPPRRGWYELGPVVAASGHPFGLWQLAVEAAGPQRLLVLPRPGKVERDKLRRFLRGASPRGERTRHKGTPHQMARADFHGLRPYRPGDSPRWVHWRTSARRGELMVREFEDVPGDDLVLVLDPSGPPGEHFEQAVTLAASLAWEWCQRHGDRLVFTTASLRPEPVDGLTGPDLARRVLEALALAGPERCSPQAAAAVRPLVPRTAAVVVVSAGPSSLPDALEGALGMPTALLDASRPEELTFFTPPPPGG